jgi:hypothetical protein
MRSGVGFRAGWGLGAAALGLSAFLVLRAQSPALAVQPEPAPVAATPAPATPEVVPITADDHPTKKATPRRRRPRHGSRIQGGREPSRRF